MKLTYAQLRALCTVEDGKVTYYEPLRISSTVKRIFGYRKDVIEFLSIAKLITLPSHIKSGCHAKYTLTDAGLKIGEKSIQKT